MTNETKPELDKELPKEESAQIVKYKRKFNMIDLTKAMKVKKAKKPIEEFPVTKFKSTKHKVEDWTIPTIMEDTDIKAHENSIRKYLNECHSDVQALIYKNGFKLIKANCGNLIVVTRNDLRIVINTLGVYERHIKITDKRKNVLFNGKTNVRFEKIKTA